MIDTKTIEKLANLARINVSVAEKESLAKEIESILSYVGQIKEAGAESLVKEIPANKNIFRNDDNPHESSIYTESLLKQSPDREKDFIRVKKIL